MKRKTIIGAVLAIGVAGLGFAFWMMWSRNCHCQPTPEC